MKIQVNNLHRPQAELSAIQDYYATTLRGVFGSACWCNKVHDDFNRAGKPPFHDWNAANNQARHKVKELFRLTPTEFQNATYAVHFEAKDEYTL